MTSGDHGLLRASILGLFALGAEPVLRGSAPAGRRPRPAAARGRRRGPESSAALRVERVDVLLQIEVRKAEAGRSPREAARFAFPAPGDSVYVHAIERPGVTLPRERSQVRVFLSPRPGGGWEGASADWFESVSPDLAANSPADPPAAAGEPTTPGVSPPASEPGRSSLPTLGLTGQGQTVKGQYVFRITSVERGGPAQRSGLEVGDVIVAVNAKPLTGFDPLAEVVNKGGPLAFVVLDVNSGNAARVTVEAVKSPVGNPPIATNAPPVEPKENPTQTPQGRRRLGLSAETVTIGQRTALKVTRVHPNSPASEAGIEVGDVIVAVNDIPITGVEAMNSALRKGGSDLKFTVRDSRSGRDAEVKVSLGGPTAPSGLPTQPTSRPTPSPSPMPTGNRPSGGGGRLGVVSELVFLETDPAVKVTEVVPGSPAARAGVAAGMIIQEANGTPVLHPNTLNEVVAQSGTKLRLTVVDPATGRRGNLEVDLGNR
ncbi:MAG: PDZ domain-containing protein [Isosphaeraceae bacterium]